MTGMKNIIASSHERVSQSRQWQRKRPPDTTGWLDQDVKPYMQHDSKDVLKYTF